MRLIKVRNNQQVQEVVVALSKAELSVISRIANLAFYFGKDTVAGEEIDEVKQELLDEQMVEELYHQSVLKQQSHEGGEIR